MPRRTQSKVKRYSGYQQYTKEHLMRLLRNKNKFPRKTRIGRPPRSFRPSVYKFKRNVTQTIDLNNIDGTGWDLMDNAAMQKGISVALSSISDYTQFTNLFEQYKLTGLRLQIIPSWNSIRGVGVQSQIICYIMKSRFGYVVDNMQEVLAKQAKKKFIAFRDGRPIDVFMKLNQLNETYGTTVTTDYTIQRPKWISTQEINTQHYGYDIVLQTVSGRAFTDMEMSVKIFTTVYFQCRGVKASSAD